MYVSFTCADLEARLVRSVLLLAFCNCSQRFDKGRLRLAYGGTPWARLHLRSAVVIRPQIGPNLWLMPEERSSNQAANKPVHNPYTQPLFTRDRNRHLSEDCFRHKNSQIAERAKRSTRLGRWSERRIKLSDSENETVGALLQSSLLE